MRFVRSLALTVAGALAGFMSAAAFAKRAVRSRGGEESDDVALVAIYDGVQLRSRAGAFRGGSMLAWYGGIQLDLSEATLAPDVHFTVHALFGGVAVRVPPGCRVESAVKALGGGVAVRRPATEGETGPRVRLDGLAVFGGVAVGAGEPS